MPPVRTNSVPIKPMKTERTHEENQERAYIAASRRSDRSLEARIESARRASEIHKKRTGRSLRVTEKDVVNEEMYEEEDDNLPAQYRRLTAHIQTSSLDFNRRLHAYIQSQAGTRDAVAASNGPAFGSGFPFQFPNAAQYPSHQMMQPIFPPQIMPPQMYQQPAQNYRHTPYPMSPAVNTPRPSLHHQRSASIATPQDASFRSDYPATSSSETPRPDELRRNSMPSDVLQPISPSKTDDSQRPDNPRTSTNIHNLKLSSSPPAFNANQSASTPLYSGTPISQHDAQMQRSQYMDGFPLGFNAASQHANTNPFDPFTVSLPIESQQFLGGSTPDLNNFYSAMLMNCSQQTNQPFYSYNPNPIPKTQVSNSSSAGMNQTLAPSLDDLKPQSPTSSNPYPSTMAKAECIDTPFNPNFGYDFDGNFGDSQSALMTRANSVHGSPGTVTPNDWSNFIEPSAWETPSQ